MTNKPTKPLSFPWLLKYKVIHLEYTRNGRWNVNSWPVPFVSLVTTFSPDDCFTVGAVVNYAHCQTAHSSSIHVISKRDRAHLAWLWRTEGWWLKPGSPARPASCCLSVHVKTWSGQAQSQNRTHVLDQAAVPFVFPGSKSVLGPVPLLSVLPLLLVQLKSSELLCFITPKPSSNVWVGGQTARTIS